MDKISEEAREAAAVSYPYETLEELGALLLRLSTAGMRAFKAQVLQSFSAGLLSQEEIERQWGRLTAAEQETFLMLLAKL